MPKLTDAFIKKFAVPGGAKDRLVFDSEVRGLGIRATASGGKLFLLQWVDAATHKKHREPLGAWGSITVDQARTAARVRLGRIAAGINPATERAEARAQAERQRVQAAQAKDAAKFTLEILIRDWSRLHLAGRKERYAAEAQRALRYAFATHLDRPAAALDHAAVISILDKIAGAGNAAIAGRTQSYGRACFGWAVARRKLAVNPFAGLPSIENSTPSRDRVLTDAELGAVWRAAGALPAPFGPIVQLLALTAARRTEVASLAWSELSADLSVWTIPAARAKNGKAHIVHLAPAAQAILRAVPRIDGQDLVFSTTGKTAPTGFSRAKSQLDRRLAEGGVTAEWRFHDFRRTAVTWLAGAGFPPHVADKLLNHVSGTIKGVAAVYQRNEFLAERKAAIEAWATHVLRCGEGNGAAENVVQLRAGAAA